MSQSIENYLKGIYILKQNDSYSNKKLAEYLNISPASVSEMMKKLVKDGYLSVDGRNINFTEKGEARAKNIIRRHRVWEVFLLEKLEYELDEVHDEAEILEHITSEKLLRKLEKFLFYPKECPHGSPIYYDSDKFFEKSVVKLSEVKKGEEVVIVNVEENIELYDYLKELDIKIKEEYLIEKIDPFNKALHLKNKEKDVKIIAHEATKMIGVYKK